MSADGTLTAQANATRHQLHLPHGHHFAYRTSIPTKLGASDLVIIAKAGEALRGRGYRYYCDWRPIRGWEKFCKDLIIAFPDRDTPDVPTTETRSFAAFIVFVMRVGDYTESNMALTMEKPKPPSGSDSQGMSEANIKLWLARVLLTRWEQKALRVQQPNGQTTKKPVEAEKPEKPTESKVPTVATIKHQPLPHESEARDPSKTKLESAADLVIPAKNHGWVLRIRASVTDLLSDPRSNTGGSAQIRGVATLQASPRIAHRLCLSSGHLNLQWRFYDRGVPKRLWHIHRAEEPQHKDCGTSTGRENRNKIKAVAIIHYHEVTIARTIWDSG
ncbi:hypothetical protein GEV33_010441 [Tenebrio molitor]|uniref:Uncharacterized protein n=1 Tax=Tenebrio molitor TaxID=7067 RepID=A0A8J6HDT1_TENMO|nr:hypothetical protein GEV33_010441 [Tenebrio molitor]